MLAVLAVLRCSRCLSQERSSRPFLRLAQVAKEVSKPEVDTLLAAETGGDEFAAAQLCS